MKVSVVIPIFNGERTLKQCISSLLKQTYKNYEIILVDNNSTDKTRAIIDFYRRISPIKAVFEPCRSRGAARNAGINHAEGEIIICSDCDCIFSQDWIERLIEPIRLGKAIAVQGGEAPAKLNFWTIQYQKSSDIDTAMLRRYSNYIDTKNFAILKSALLQCKGSLGFFNPRMIYSDDIEFANRFFRKYQIAYLPECKVWHYHPDSLSKTIKTNFWKGYYTKKARIIKKNFAAKRRRSFSRTIYTAIHSLSAKLGELYSIIN